MLKKYTFLYTSFILVGYGGNAFVNHGLDSLGRVRGRDGDFTTNRNLTGSGRPLP